MSWSPLNEAAIEIETANFEVQLDGCSTFQLVLQLGHDLFQNDVDRV